MAQIFKFLLAAALLAVGLPVQASTAPSVTGFIGEQPAINQTRFIILFDSPIEGLEREDFTLSSGCTFAYLEIMDATAQVELVDCTTGRVTLTLRANSMGASVLGPARDEKFEIEIDATAPSATFSDIQLAGSGPFSYSAQLRFSEAVEFDATTLVFSSTGPCESRATAVSGGFDVQAVCGYTELSWTLPARSLRDSYGNLGPYRDIKVSLANLAPAPPSTPSPTPTPTPTPTPPVVSIPIPAPVEAAPLPQSPSPMEVLPPIAVVPSSSAEVAAIASSESITAVIEQGMVIAISPPTSVAHEPAGISGNAQNDLTIQESSTMAESSTELKQPVVKDSQPMIEKAAAVAAEDGVEVRETDNSIGVWMIGTGSISLILLGLYRRFSGR
jgi:hypothetical protein